MSESILWTKRGWLKYDQTLTDDRMRRPRKAMHIITALILLKWSFRFRCPTCRGSLLYILQDPHAFTWPNSIQVKREREMLRWYFLHNPMTQYALGPYSTLSSRTNRCSFQQFHFRQLVSNSTNFATLIEISMKEFRLLPKEVLKVLRKPRSYSQSQQSNRKKLV